MWSGGISGRNRVRPAEEWVEGLTCQTAKTPACHIQIVERSLFIIISYHTYQRNSLFIFLRSIFFT